MDELVELLEEALPDITGKSYYWGGLTKRAIDRLRAYEAALADTDENVERLARLLEPNSWFTKGKVPGDSVALRNRRTSSLRKARAILTSIREGVRPVPLYKSEAKEGPNDNVWLTNIGWATPYGATRYSASSPSRVSPSRPFGEYRAHGR